MMAWAMASLIVATCLLAALDFMLLGMIFLLDLLTVAGPPYPGPR